MSGAERARRFRERIKAAKARSKANDENGNGSRQGIRRPTGNKPSLKTLITWNVSKALEINPQINLRAAFKETQERLEKSHNVDALLSVDACNLSCAILAWEQLGHHNTDSLFSFVEKTLKENGHRKNIETLRETFSSKNEYNCSGPSYRNVAGQNNANIEQSSRRGDSNKMDFSTSIGLVVKLPADPHTVMHLTGPVRIPNKTNKCSSRGRGPGCGKSAQSGTISKINSACCLEKGCMQRLAAMEGDNEKLRKRAAQVARREAERAELLERAEMAWRDLDASYQRRLRLAKEKEEDIAKQTERILEERNRYRESCMPLVAALKKKSLTAEKDRDALTQLEQEVCERACVHLELVKQETQVDTQLTGHQCKAAQLDRDLALKEEQEMRKQRSLAGAAEAAQVLTHEAEYAQRAELAALKAQVQQVAQELLEEDARTTLLMQRIADYSEEKDEMIEDLEACQTKCDVRMGALIEDLKKKKDQLLELENKVIECVCKDPVDRAVEVKRTPSLAALCKCSPSDLIHGTCSCTSLRTRLLSALLRDLFGGLKAEMENIGSHMPCHLLKCLEDKHNWDRTTDVKTSIRAYFSNLLLGELDIAIAAVIEKCHAQWVGECCADLRKLPPPPNSKNSLRWQEHELEMKTQKMATKIAEKMFQDKAKELAKQAQDFLSTDGRPPCECNIENEQSSAQYASAVYRCVVQPQPVRNLNKTKNSVVTSVNDHRRNKVVTQLTHMENVKKDAKSAVTSFINNVHVTDRNRKKDGKNLRSEIISKNSGGAPKPGVTRRNLNVNARKTNKSISNKGDLNKGGINVIHEEIKGPHQYAVNMCICDSNCNRNWKKEPELSCNQKPTLSFSPEVDSLKESDANDLPSCSEKCACFHKLPSNTSINRLIDILTKWKDNLIASPESNIKEALNTDSLFKVTHTSIVNVLQQLCGQMESKKSLKAHLDQDVTSHNKIEVSHDSKKTVENVKDCSRTIIPNQIEINHSQYMGAINLDKSNNVLCKHGTIVEDKVKNNNIPFQYNSMHSVNFVDNSSISANREVQIIKMQHYIATGSQVEHDNNVCINTSFNKSNNDKLGHGEMLPIVNNLKPSSALHKDCQNCIQCLGVVLANATSKQLLSKDAKLVSQNQNHQQKKYNHDKSDDKLNSRNNCAESSDEKNNKNIDHLAKRLPKHCENCMKFLGVTLDNKNMKRMSKKNPTQQGNQNGDWSHRKDEFLHQEKTINYDELDDKRFKSKDNRDLRKTRRTMEEIKALNVLHLHNECTYKDAYNRVDHLSINKSVDVRDEKINDLSNERCVCCRTLGADISNDLEVNAFQLLEDHIKHQLKEFKLSVCKSSCMQNADEKNLVNDTLFRVKQLILESASAVTYKYAGSSRSCDGSWNRAYSLLQEYLKTKIARVKRQCDSSGSSQEDNLVPRVLSKINCLIESDLQRLKAICKCKNTTSESQYMDEINISKNENYMTTEILESMYVNYTYPSCLPYNKSAQASFHQPVITRSCEALKTNITFSEVQTIDIVKDSENNIADDYGPIIKKDKDELNKEKKVDSVKNNEGESNQYSGMPISERPIERTLTFKNTEFTVMPVAMPSVERINENYTNKTEILLDQQKQDNLRPNDEKVTEPFQPYIGCTINCCCDSDLGCVCTKSTIPYNTDWLKTNNIWNTFTKKQSVTEHFSYILSNISNKLPKNIAEVSETQNPNQCESKQITNVKKNVSPKKSNESVELDHQISKTEINEASEPKKCESEVSATEEKNIYLKKSKQRLARAHGTTNTYTNENSHQFGFMPPKFQRNEILKRNKSEFSKRALVHFCNSDTRTTNDDAAQVAEYLSSSCDCAKVPVCHVKKLMESIGNKLAQAECTCDTIKSVCPVHSR